MKEAIISRSRVPREKIAGLLNRREINNERSADMRQLGEKYRKLIQKRHPAKAGSVLLLVETKTISPIETFGMTSWEVNITEDRLT